jgi:hypothetical protein
MFTSMFLRFPSPFLLHFCNFFSCNSTPSIESLVPLVITHCLHPTIHNPLAAKHCTFSSFQVSPSSWNPSFNMSDTNSDLRSSTRKKSHAIWSNNELPKPKEKETSDTNKNKNSKIVNNDSPLLKKKPPVQKSVLHSKSSPHPMQQNMMDFSTKDNHQNNNFHSNDEDSPHNQAPPFLTTHSPELNPVVQEKKILEDLFTFFKRDEVLHCATEKGIHCLTLRDCLFISYIVQDDVLFNQQKGPSSSASNDARYTNPSTYRSYRKEQFLVIVGAIKKIHYDYFNTTLTSSLQAANSKTELEGTPTLFPNVASPHTPFFQTNSSVTDEKPSKKLKSEPSPKSPQKTFYFAAVAMLWFYKPHCAL